MGPLSPALVLALGLELATGPAEVPSSEDMVLMEDFFLVSNVSSLQKKCNLSAFRNYFLFLLTCN